MEKLYCSHEFPVVTTMLLDKQQQMGEHLLRKELDRLISMEQTQQAINQAVDLLAIMDRPSDKRELLEMIMQTDEIYSLLQETKGMMVLADEDMIEEHEQKTLYSFLIDLTNWLETR
jgi:Trp operon repressor